MIPVNGRSILTTSTVESPRNLRPVRRSMEAETPKRTDAATWWQTFNDLETSLRRLCDEARNEDCPERLDVIAAMLHEVEGELLEGFQRYQWACEDCRPVHPALRPFLVLIESVFRHSASMWEWQAAGIRTRLKGGRRE